MAAVLASSASLSVPQVTGWFREFLLLSVLLQTRFGEPGVRIWLGNDDLYQFTLQGVFPAGPLEPGGAGGAFC